MLRTSCVAAVVMCAALQAGCAPPPPATEAGAAPTRPVRRSNTLITREELAAITSRDALGAVRTLRPEWLHARGAISPQAGVPPLVVYLDGNRVGTRDVLSQISTAHIREIRYLNATDATQKWGTDHQGGVIEVITH